MAKKAGLERQAGLKLTARREAQVKAAEELNFAPLQYSQSKEKLRVSKDDEIHLQANSIVLNYRYGEEDMFQYQKTYLQTCVRAVNDNFYAPSGRSEQIAENILKNDGFSGNKGCKFVLVSGHSILQGVKLYDNW